MAVTTKKSKTKSSPASRAKAKSKSKVTKADAKVKKAIAPAKTKKSKKAKVIKSKATEIKATSKKMAPAKTKAKAKPPVKATSPSPKIAKPKAQLKAVTTKAKVVSEKVINEMPSNIAMMQAPVAESVPGTVTKTTDSYMNKKQLTQFKGLLEQWKRELMEEVDHTLVEMKEAGVLADPNDCATQEETFNLELRTRDRERKLLKKIEEALQKIDNEEYGYCESCGIEIGIRRLEARPTATLCIDCKTLDEIKEKRS
jgi:DnaK suppressor protein